MKVHAAAPDDVHSGSWRARAPAALAMAGLFVLIATPARSQQDATAFFDAPTVATGDNGLDAIARSDFDLDGWLDLAATNWVTGPVGSPRPWSTQRALRRKASWPATSIRTAAPTSR